MISIGLGCPWSKKGCHFGDSFLFGKTLIMSRFHSAFKLMFFEVVFWGLENTKIPVFAQISVKPLCIPCPRYPSGLCEKSRLTAFKTKD